MFFVDVLVVHFLTTCKALNTVAETYLYSNLKVKLHAGQLNLVEDAWLTSRTGRLLACLHQRGAAGREMLALIPFFDICITSTGPSLHDDLADKISELSLSILDRPKPNPA